ncbi:FABP family protein [Actinomyces vulturis]|uniref:FABP family protein n=1 Tax=Actinomyces vulturis TaxID=1857645 RepID=UPI0008304744|nr:FABP family protein [Actinomyces vulturis]
MAFTFPDNISPEIYPLAWLLGTWRGYGILTYGDAIDEQVVYQEMTFDEDGGPYVRQITTLWTVDATKSENLDFEMSGAEGASRITPAQVWSTETAYWRPVGQRPEIPEDAKDGQTMPETDKPARPSTPITDLELITADPAGHVAVWEGYVQGPRIELASQAVGRTRTAVEVREMGRMFGLVNSDLMWTQDMAAFGQEMGTYASGRLSRLEEGGSAEPPIGQALGEREDSN